MLALTVLYMMMHMKADTTNRPTLASAAPVAPLPYVVWVGVLGQDTKHIQA